MPDPSRKVVEVVKGGLPSVSLRKAIVQLGVIGIAIGMSNLNTDNNDGD